MAVAARRATALPDARRRRRRASGSPAQAYINGRLGESIGSAEAAAAINNGVGLACAAGGHRGRRRHPARAALAVAGALLAPARRPGRRDVHRRGGDRRAGDRRGAAERRARLRADDGQPGRRRRRAEPGRASGRHHGPRRRGGADDRGGHRLRARRQRAPARRAPRASPSPPARPARCSRRPTATSRATPASRSSPARSTSRSGFLALLVVAAIATGLTPPHGWSAPPLEYTAGLARRRDRHHDGGARLAPGRPAADPGAHRRARPSAAWRST